MRFWRRVLAANCCVATRVHLGNLFVCAMFSMASVPFFTNCVLGQMITAHRGASFDAPENTLSAFRLAWEQNADAIEGDFYLTADKQIVCIHDKDTARTAGEKLSVEDSTLEQLRALQYGAWKNESFRGESIPTFEEVLRCVPEGKRFVIELKSDSRIVPHLADALTRLNANTDTCLIISFNEATIALCKQQMPHVRAHWLVSFEKDAQGNMVPHAQSIASTAATVGADGVGLQGNRSVIDKMFVETLMQGNCREFHVWTIDDPKDANYFRDLGAVGITTNKPGFMRRELSSD
jgi:glycerophosphoryl diester phosphodiesterase